MISKNLYRNVQYSALKKSYSYYLRKNIVYVSVLRGLNVCSEKTLKSGKIIQQRFMFYGPRPAGGAGL